eukprot:2651001-Ditylum_brightwellii.AAC.1
MDVVREMLVKFGKECIKDAKDMAKFDNDTWKQAVDNLKHPGGWLKNLDKDSSKDSTVPQTTYVFGAKMQKRLFKAYKLTRFYEMVGHK